MGLVGDVSATAELVSFRFDEVLAFNVPLHPKVRYFYLKICNRLVCLPFCAVPVVLIMCCAAHLVARKPRRGSTCVWVCACLLLAPANARTLQKVKLTGRVDLVRNPTTGLITSYREFWDQSIGEVLKSARI